MCHTGSENWFTIDLDEPSYIIPEPSSNSSQNPTSHPQHDTITGTISLRLSKHTKIKSLAFTFTGFFKSSFYFDSSDIPEAKPYVSYNKSNYECTLVEHKETILCSESKKPHILPIGTHKYPFSIKINEYWPRTVTSQAIDIHYQVEASIQLQSILPFGSLYHTTQPVILLQKDEHPSDSLFSMTSFNIISKTSLVSSKIVIPCAVLPKAGTIPIDFNVVLKGNGTSITKLALELVENIHALPHDDNDKCVLVDERVVSRQNCPIVDWSSSTIRDPVTILKRLMFKVPQPAHSTWSSLAESLQPTLSRPKLKRGFCHPSGEIRNAKLRISHIVRAVIEVSSLNEAGNTAIFESGANEASVWIAGNQEYDEDCDDTNPPSYIRSFSSKLVDKEEINEIDQLAIEALQYDLTLNSSPPCYEECFAESSSTSTSPTLSPWICPSQSSLDHCESRSSSDTHVFDLVSNTERNSRRTGLAM